LNPSRHPGARRRHPQDDRQRARHRRPRVGHHRLEPEGDQPRRDARPYPPPDEPLRLLARRSGARGPTAHRAGWAAGGNRGERLLSRLPRKSAW